MERVEKILNNEEFLDLLGKIDALEKDRIFCKHGLSHLLDVARIGWILILEEGISIKKDIFYAAALLHDLGRYDQYTKEIPHAKASAELAKKLLPDAGFLPKEVEQIARAISLHGKECDRTHDTFSWVLYRADKLSRNCFVCKAQKECNWKDEKRNRTIKY